LKKQAMTHVNRQHKGDGTVLGGTGRDFTLSELFATVLSTEESMQYYEERSTKSSRKDLVDKRNKSPQELAREILTSEKDPEQRLLLQNLLKMMDPETPAKLPEISTVPERNSTEKRKGSPSRKAKKRASSCINNPEVDLSVREGSSSQKRKEKQGSTTEKRSLLEADLQVSSDDSSSDYVSLDVSRKEMEELIGQPKLLSPLPPEVDKQDHTMKTCAAKTDQVQGDKLSNTSVSDPSGLEGDLIPAWTVADIVHQTIDAVTSTLVAGIQRERKDELSAVCQNLLTTINANINITNTQLKRLVEIKESNHEGQRLLEAVDRMSGQVTGLKTAVKENQRALEDFTAITKDFQSTCQEQNSTIKSLIQSQIDANHAVAKQLERQGEAFRAITKRFNGLIEDDRRGGSVPKVVRHIVASDQEKVEFNEAWEDVSSEIKHRSKVYFGPMVRVRPVSAPSSEEASKGSHQPTPPVAKASLPSVVVRPPRGPSRFACSGESPLHPEWVEKLGQIRHHQSK
jgi:hypothetical protein